MAVVFNRPTANRVILWNVSWETYESLVKDLENSGSPRLAFNQGVLEIMSPHLEHEDVNRTLASIVEITLEETDLDFRNAGSTTFKREDVKRAFEPDSCFYIQNVDAIRGKKKIDMLIDPPPDLLIEIDLTNDSLNKFPLYHALRVPEVWRYKDGLEISVLSRSGYSRRPVSAAIPVLTEKIGTELLTASFTMKRPAWLRETRKRIRKLIRAVKS